MGISPPVSPVAPTVEVKTHRLAGQPYSLLMRLLFQGDPSQQSARSASQLAGRSAHLHHGASVALEPELRGHCKPVRDPFGVSQSGGMRLQLQKRRGPRASIGFRARGPPATGGSCGGLGGGGPLPPCTASLRLGPEWSFCCHLRLPLPEPSPTATEKRRVRTLAMGLSREGRAVHHVLMLEERMVDGAACLTLGVGDSEAPEQLTALNLHALPHGWHSLVAVGSNDKTHFYVNGRLQGSVPRQVPAWSNAAPGSAQARVGFCASSGRAWRLWAA